jgi:osmoprotectant transport system substrate-binding protein
MFFSLTACSGRTESMPPASEVPSAGADSTSAANTVVNKNDPIRITTLSELEGTSVGQVMAQALIANGYEIVDQTGSSASVDIMRQALLNGEVNMIWDYDGDAVSYFDTSWDPFYNFKEGWELIRDYDLKNNNVVWLEPTPANNNGLIACTSKFAEDNGLLDMDDFAEYVNNGGEVILVAPSWWINGEFKHPLMEEAYGYALRDDQFIVVEGLNERMVAEGVDGANFCLIFNNQGSLNELDMVAILDNKGSVLRYSYCPVISKETLDKYPGIEEILNPIFSQMSDADVRWLNEQVQIAGRPGDEVAIEYLTEKGFME